mmetsp:Transcript_39620/g.112355  ORF Transcript_39620/g.112355 Transcript_39620/m.112355 type:complete len:242 (+) Transcript_39620:2137-2862(+)
MRRPRRRHLPTTRPRSRPLPPESRPGSPAPLPRRPPLPPLSLPWPSRLRLRCPRHLLRMGRSSSQGRKRRLPRPSPGPRPSSSQCPSPRLRPSPSQCPRPSPSQCPKPSPSQCPSPRPRPGPRPSQCPIARLRPNLSQCRSPRLSQRPGPSHSPRLHLPRRQRSSNGRRLWSPARAKRRRGADSRRRKCPWNCRPWPRLLLLRHRAGPRQWAAANQGRPNRSRLRVGPLRRAARRRPSASC